MPDAAPLPHRLTLPLRFSDFDMVGHLNQAVYHTLLEQARVLILRNEVPSLGPCVLARVELDHRREVAVGDLEVTVESAVSHVGGASTSLLHRLVRADGVLAAEATIVLVGWDPAARGKRQLTDAARAELEALKA